MKYAAYLLSCYMLLSASILFFIPNAMAEEKGNWREKVARMSPQEREAFYKTRTRLKSRIMSMSNEERMQFYNQIEATRGRWGEPPHYIKATPKSEVKEEQEYDALLESDQQKENLPIRKRKTMQDWSELSLEDKRLLIQELSE